MTRETEGLLSPYRILDLTDETGVVGGRILADLGADVIKVEPPGGDRCRNIGPFYHDITDPEKSLFWLAYNANKRGITLNLQSTEGRELFKKLARAADAMLESFPPGYMDGLGLGYGDPSKINPGIIVTSVTPFGQTGPYRDFKGPDLITWSLGGMTYVSSDPDRPPLRVSVPQAYPQAGAVAATGTVFALFHRGVTGEGQHVDVSIMDQVVHCLMNVRQFWEMCGISLTRAGQFRTGLSSSANQRVIWQCKGGYVNYPIFGGKTGARSNQALTDWMRSEGIADDYLSSLNWLEYDMAQATEEQFARMSEPIGLFFKQHTLEDLFAGAIERGIMLYPVYSPKEIMEDVHLQHRQFWVTLEHPELGDTIAYPGPFVTLSEAQCGLRRRAPLVGEHNHDIYAELDLSADDLLRLEHSGVV